MKKWYCLRIFWDNGLVSTLVVDWIVVALKLKEFYENNPKVVKVEMTDGGKDEGTKEIPS